MYWKRIYLITLPLPSPALQKGFFSHLLSPICCNISQKSVIEVQSSTLVGKTYNLCAAGCQSYPPLKLLTTDNQHNCCPPENPRLHLFKPGIEPQRISLNGICRHCSSHTGNSLKFVFNLLNRHSNDSSAVFWSCLRNNIRPYQLSTVLISCKICMKEEFRYWRHTKSRSPENYLPWPTTGSKSWFGNESRRSSGSGWKFPWRLGELVLKLNFGEVDLMWASLKSDPETEFW